MRITYDEDELVNAVRDSILNQLKIQENMDLEIVINKSDAGYYGATINVIRKALNSTSLTPAISRVSEETVDVVVPQEQTVTAVEDETPSSTPDKPIEDMTPEEFAALPRGVRAAHTRKLNKQAETVQETKREEPAAVSTRAPGSSLFPKIATSVVKPPFTVDETAATVEQDMGDQEPTDEQLAASNEIHADRSMDQAMAIDSADDDVVTAEEVVEAPEPAPVVEEVVIEQAAPAEAPTAVRAKSLFGNRNAAK